MLSLIFYAFLILVGIVIIGLVIRLVIGTANIVLTVVSVIVGTIWRYKVNLLLLAVMLWLTESPILAVLAYACAVYIASRRDASKNITGQLQKMVDERPVSYQEIEKIRPESDSPSHILRSLTCPKEKGIKIMQKWVNKGIITSKKLYDDKVYYYHEENLVALENKISDHTIKCLDDKFEKFGLYDLKNGITLDVFYQSLRSLENAYQKIVMNKNLQDRVSKKIIKKIYLGKGYEECVYIETKRLYEIGESLMQQDIFDQQHLEEKVGKHTDVVYAECINQWNAEGLDFSICDENTDSGIVYITHQLKQKAVAAIDKPNLNLKNFIFDYDKYTMQVLVCVMNYLVREIKGFVFEPATDSKYQYWINEKFKHQYQCNICKKLFVNLVQYNGLRYCNKCLENLRKEERKKERQVITEKKYIDAPPPDVIVKLH